jgi:phytanoyl-CoA hydroxylase
MYRLFLLIFSLFVLPAFAQEARVFRCPVDGKLTREMTDYFHNNGFLILDNFISERQTQDLTKHINSLVNEFDFDELGIHVFAGDDEGKTVGQDKYFIDSAEQIRPFLERDAVKHIKTYEQEGIKKIHLLNKIGHNLHNEYENFKHVTFSVKSQNIAKSLGYDEDDTAVFQSMALFKSPLFKSNVDPHQDLTFLHNANGKILGFWVAISDANVNNGCLWAIPESHKFPLKKLFVRESVDSYKTVLKTLTNDVWDVSKAVALPAKAGTLVVFDGKLVHDSRHNNSKDLAGERFAYAWHIGSEAGFDELNWIRSSNGFTKLY